MKFRPLGIEIRAGLRTGECEEMIGDDVGAHRCSHWRPCGHALAGASEKVLVSSTVRDLVAGSGLALWRSRGKPIP